MQLDTPLWSRRVFQKCHLYFPDIDTPTTSKKRKIQKGNTKVFQGIVSPLKAPKPSGSDSAKTMDIVSGYIHNMTSINTSKSGTQYLNFTMQTDGNKYQRAVSFSPDIHQEFLSKAQRNRLAISLKNVQFSPSKQFSNNTPTCPNKKRKVQKANTKVFQGIVSSLKAPKPSGSHSDSTKTMDIVSGYVHNITSLNASKNGMQYLNFTMQTDGNKYQRAVYFSPDIHQEFLLRAQQNRLGTSLKNVQFSQSKQFTGQMDIKINYRTKLSTIITQFAHKVPEILITDIAKIHDLLLTTNINVKVKVVKEGKVEMLGARNQQKNIVADITGFIQLAVWEDKIPLIKL